MASKSVVHFMVRIAMMLPLGAVLISCGGGRQAVPLPAPEARVSVAPHDEEVVTLAAPPRRRCSWR